MLKGIFDLRMSEGSPAVYVGSVVNCAYAVGLGSWFSNRSIHLLPAILLIRFLMTICS